MSDDTARPTIEPADPVHATEVTGSGQPEAPALRRKIDCAGSPEVADRRRFARGPAPVARSDP